MQDWLRGERREGKRRHVARRDKEKEEKNEPGMKGELELFGASVPERREGRGKRRKQDETKRRKKEETQGRVWRKCSLEVRMNVGESRWWEGGRGLDEAWNGWADQGKAELREKQRDKD